jgi:hypothetical protein
MVRLSRLKDGLARVGERKTCGSWNETKNDATGVR